MALRIKADGSIWCAALNPRAAGDTYISDDLHEALVFSNKVLVTSAPEHHFETGGQWWWRGSAPRGLVDPFYEDLIMERS